MSEVDFCLLVLGDQEEGVEKRDEGGLVWLEKGLRLEFTEEGDAD